MKRNKLKAKQGRASETLNGGENNRESRGKVSMVHWVTRGGNEKSGKVAFEDSENNGACNNFGKKSCVFSWAGSEWK